MKRKHTARGDYVVYHDVPLVREIKVLAGHPRVRATRVQGDRGQKDARRQQFRALSN